MELKVKTKPQGIGLLTLLIGVAIASIAIVAAIYSNQSALKIRHQVEMVDAKLDLRTYVEENLLSKIDCVNSTAGNACTSPVVVTGKNSANAVSVPNPMTVNKLYQVRLKCASASGKKQLFVEYLRTRPDGGTEIDPATKKPIGWEDLFNNLPISECGNPLCPRISQFTLAAGGDPTNCLYKVSAGPSSPNPPPWGPTVACNGGGQTLAPGNYGVVGLTGGCILRLTAGTYNFAGPFAVNSGGTTIVADVSGGDIKIVTGLVGFAVTPIVQIIGGNADNFCLEAKDNFVINTNSLYRGNVYVANPGNSLWANSGGKIQGRVFVRGSINADPNSVSCPP